MTPPTGHGVGLRLLPHHHLRQQQHGRYNYGDHVQVETDQGGQRGNGEALVEVGKAAQKEEIRILFRCHVFPQFLTLIFFRSIEANQ